MLQVATLFAWTKVNQGAHNMNSPYVKQSCFETPRLFHPHTHLPSTPSYDTLHLRLFLQPCCGFNVVLGIVYSFGSGLGCGRGSTEPQMTPEMVEGGLKGKKILSCKGGGGFSAVVCADGSIWTWGYVYFSILCVHYICSLLVLVIPRQYCNLISKTYYLSLCL